MTLTPTSLRFGSHFQVRLDSKYDVTRPGFQKFQRRGGGPDTTNLFAAEKYVHTITKAIVDESRDVVSQTLTETPDLLPPTALAFYSRVSPHRIDLLVPDVLDSVVETFLDSRVARAFKDYVDVSFNGKIQSGFSGSDTHQNAKTIKAINALYTQIRRQLPPSTRILMGDGTRVAGEVSNVQALENPPA